MYNLTLLYTHMYNLTLLYTHMYNLTLLYTHMYNLTLLYTHMYNLTLLYTHMYPFCFVISYSFLSVEINLSELTTLVKNQVTWLLSFSWLIDKVREYLGDF